MIGKVRLGKAAGHDEIALQMIKYMGNEGGKLLLKVINLA